MYSFFGEPRDTHRTRRRQDRQDFFPSFSNSLFYDPISQQGRSTSQGDHGMDDPELYADHRLKPQIQRPQHQRPQHHQQPHLRQQEEQRRRASWEQQQRHNDDDDKGEDDDEDEDNNERLRQIAKQQQQLQLLQQQQQQHQHQHQQHRAAAERKAKQQQQQQHPTTQDTSPAKHSHRPTRTQRQQPEQQQKSPGRSEEGSSKRNRRQRRRDRLACRIGGEATATFTPQESKDDMQSLVESAFGEKTMQSDSPGLVPKPKVTSASQYEDDSDEASDHISSDQDNSATEEYSADEEESIQPDPDLQELSQELHKILSGEISNKRHILLTEENLTKAMLRIDAVESGGDDSVRKQRKGLIDKAERLLEKVDEYKHRTKTCTFNRSH
ncbi:hypothetical protein BGZ67_005197 [Mortierella alpina]|nr:hypothetical protein BGZ67_005197 [Mortierella alpina]